MEYRDNVNKRIALKLCDKTGLWYMPLTSMFEKAVWDLSKPPEVSAVYRLSFKGHVQNIGQTNNLARRLKEKEVMEIPIDSVEYSDMSHATDEQRRDCEWELLEAYKKEFYHYPPHNKQGGRKIKN